MKNNRIYGGQAFGIAIGTTMIFLMLAGNAVAGGAGAATSISSCGITISSPGDYVLTTSLSSSSTCITISSSDVILDGAGNTITGSGIYSGSHGIHVYNGATITNVTVENLAVTNYGVGIYYNNIQQGNILNNIANSNFVGISLSSSSNNTLTGNTANLTPFGGSGFRLDSSSNNNTLASNTANQNDGTGIILDASSGNNLNDSTASSNGDIGIWLTDSSNNNNLNNNTMNQNGFGCCGGGHTGLLISSSSNNNTVTGSTASGNQRGVVLSSATNNLIYNNYFNNTNNAYDDGNNVWNTTEQDIFHLQNKTNIIGGPNLGGNFWSDYMGLDLDGDGIGDTLLPYNSSWNIVNGGDLLPLVTPQQQIQNINTTVMGLVNSGILTMEQGNSLMVKLNAAMQSLDPNTIAAINQLRAFENQVMAFSNAGILTAEQVRLLTEAANSVISLLSG